MTTGRASFLLMVLAAAVLAVACGGSSVPEAVASRPELPSCSEQAEVYLPVTQGPQATRETSQQALDCFWSDVEAEEPVELEFILLGTEGEEYQAVIQYLDDGTVNYYRETDGGWEINLGCSNLTMPAPGIPDVLGCHP